MVSYVQQSKLAHLERETADYGVFDPQMADRQALTVGAN